MRETHKESTMTAQTPQQAFITHVEIARELCDDLKDVLDEFLGVDPDAVNWANVGDSQHIVYTLEGLLKHVMREPE